MADIFTKAKRSEVMSRIRPKGTKPELLVFAYLRKQKIYFKRHHRIGRFCIDIAQPSKKTAVLVDGDFWHGWRFARWREDLPAKYWRGKIEANIARDKRFKARLRREGWRVMRIWEHELSAQRRQRTLSKVGVFLSKASPR